MKILITLLTLISLNTFADEQPEAVCQGISDGYKVDLKIFETGNDAVKRMTIDTTDGNGPEAVVDIDAFVGQDGNFTTLSAIAEIDGEVGKIELTLDYEEIANADGESVYALLSHESEGEETLVDMACVPME